MYHPDFAPPAWQLLLIFYAICLMTMVICIFGNKYLPTVDMICAAFTAISIFIIMIALSVKAEVGRHSASYALGHYDTSFSGWGGFTFFIGLLPAAYTFSAIGMISAMAEEVDHPATKVPTAISLCVPVGGIAGLFFIIPICVTLPPLKDIIAAPGTSINSLSSNANASFCININKLLSILKHHIALDPSISIFLKRTVADDVSVSAKKKRWDGSVCSFSFRQPACSILSNANLSHFFLLLRN